MEVLCEKIQDSVSPTIKIEVPMCKQGEIILFKNEKTNKEEE